MANAFLPVSGATALSGNANSAASLSFTSLGVIDFGSAPPHECLVEVMIQASSAPGGNKQALVFVRSSLDGTNFSDAPSTATTRQSFNIGMVDLPDTNARRSGAMSVARVFNGALPRKIEVFVYNDCGVAFAATSQTGQYINETFG